MSFLIYFPLMTLSPYFIFLLKHTFRPFGSDAFKTDFFYDGIFTDDRDRTVKRIVIPDNRITVAAVIPHVACIEIIVAHKGRHAVQLFPCKSRETFQDIRLGTAHMDVSGQNHIQIGTVGVYEARKDTL